MTCFSTNRSCRRRIQTKYPQNKQNGGGEHMLCWTTLFTAELACEETILSFDPSHRFRADELDLLCNKGTTQRAKTAFTCESGRKHWVEVGASTLVVWSLADAEKSHKMSNSKKETTTVPAKAAGAAKAAAPARGRRKNTSTHPSGAPASPAAVTEAVKAAPRNDGIGLTDTLGPSADSSAKWKLREGTHERTNRRRRGMSSGEQMGVQRKGGRWGSVFGECTTETGVDGAPCLMNGFTSTN